MVKATGAPTVSAAVAVYAVPLAAVAVMVQVLPCDADAVNIPFASMTPHEAFHVTDALAVNCCVCPWPVVAVMGEMTMGEDIFAVVDATCPLPSVAVAVMVHEPGDNGAV